jgi:hypothetical protein
VYQITPFSIQGVLPVPSKLRGLVHRNWTAHLPSGAVTRVKMRRGLIWSFKTWFKNEGLRVGDLLMVTFNVPDAVIDLERVS